MDVRTAAARAAAGVAGPRLRAAVIGAGKISEQHLAFLAASPRAELAAVCDRSPALGRYAAEAYGTRAYVEAAAMLAEVRPDVVHVLTPPQSHAELVSLCLEAGAHVVVEKPVAPTHAEFLELWARAERAGRLLIEDQNYRFNRPVETIGGWIAGGRLGRVCEVEVRMNLPLHGKASRYGDANLPHPSHHLPAGVLHEFVTHLAYLSLALLPPGFEPRRVAAAWSNHAGGELFRCDDLDSLIIDGPVHARLRIDAQGMPPGFRVVVRGTKGWAETDLWQPYLRRVGPRGLGQIDALANHVANGWALIGAGLAGFRDKVMQRTAYEGLERFLTRTYEALRAGSSPPVGYAEMDAASRLIEALLDEGHRV